MVFYHSFFLVNLCTGLDSKKSIVADAYMIKEELKEEAMFSVMNGYDSTCQTMFIVFPVLLDDHVS